MILRKLRVEQFRCHNLPVEIEFGEHLTVISGPNEIGKSTLFTALEYAFFRRSNASARDIKLLGPWDTDGLTPAVTVDFEHTGDGYRLSKSFGRHGTTSLERRNAGGSYLPYMGENAEEFIAKIFAGAPPGMGAFSKFTGQHLGLAYLLFVRQAAIPILGDAKDIELNTDARAKLTEIVGAAAQSPAAARLAKKIKAAYALECGARGPRKSSPLASALVAVKEAAARTALARSDLAAFESEAGRLTEAQATAADAEVISKHAQAALDDERPRIQRAVVLQRGLHDAEAASNAARSVYDNLSEQKRRREDAERRREVLAARRTELQQQLMSAEAALEVATTARIAALEAFTVASRPNPDVVRLGQELDHSKRAQSCREQAADLERRLTKIQCLEEAEAALNVELHALPSAGDAELAQLREVIEREAELRGRLAAAETSVRFVATRAGEVGWRNGAEEGTATIVAGEAFTLSGSGALDLEIEGVGRLEVRGPAGDVAAVLSERAACERRLVEFDRCYGTRDYLVLHERILRRRELETQHGANLRALADALAGASVKQIRAQRAALNTELSAGLETGTTAELERLLATAQAAAETTASGADERLRAATAGETRAASGVRNARAEDTAFAGGEWRAVEIELESLNADRKAPSERDEMLRAAWSKKTDTELALERTRADYEPFASLADPMAELTRLQDAAQQSALLAQRASDDAENLRTSIAKSREQAPAAVLATCEEQEAALRDALATAQCAHDALVLLNTKVTEAENARVAGFAIPVLERVAPWYERVSGRRLAGLNLSGNNQIEGLRLAGVDQKIGFDELSQGAGDQLALLIRLGLAALLTAPGCLGTMPVLLDDPLVHGDARRRDEMQRILEELTGTAQIVVFTCRPEDFANSRATFVEMPLHGRSTNVASVAS
jgi:energy-coupling factor transporter ATP-binding protein EcfA2